MGILEEGSYWAFVRRVGFLKGDALCGFVCGLALTSCRLRVYGLGVGDEPVYDPGSRGRVHLLRYAPNVLVNRGQRLTQFASELAVLREAA